MQCFSGTHVDSVVHLRLGYDGLGIGDPTFAPATIAPVVISSATKSKSEGYHLAFSWGSVRIRVGVRYMEHLAFVIRALLLIEQMSYIVHININQRPRKNILSAFKFKMAYQCLIMIWYNSSVYGTFCHGILCFIRNSLGLSLPNDIPSLRAGRVPSLYKILVTSALLVLIVKHR